MSTEWEKTTYILPGQAECIALTRAEVNRHFFADFGGIWPFLKYPMQVHGEKEHDAEHVYYAPV